MFKWWYYKWIYQSNCTWNDATICCIFQLDFQLRSVAWLLAWRGSTAYIQNKGDSKSPENHRPITILSCFGKLFTSILNARLNKSLDAHNIFEENQAGFRADYSTMDHIFVLHALTEIAKTQKKKLFCSFIDLSKAFDSVWRVGLWKKLSASNINGYF